jgi:hypothetical protein
LRRCTAAGGGKTRSIPCWFRKKFLIFLEKKLLELVQTL